jgi:hypothetical protein
MRSAIELRVRDAVESICISIVRHSLIKYTKSSLLYLFLLFYSSGACLFVFRHQLLETMNLKYKRVYYPHVLSARYLNKAAISFSSLKARRHDGLCCIVISDTALCRS